MKKNAGKLKGKNHEISIMKDIIEVPLETVVEENIMNRNYRIVAGLE